MSPRRRSASSDMEMRRRRHQQDRDEEPSRAMEVFGGEGQGGDQQLVGQELVKVAEVVTAVEARKALFHSPAPAKRERPGEIEGQGSSEVSRMTTQVPTGVPRAREPPLPLFSEEQVRRMEDTYRQSPLLFPDKGRPMRPEFLPPVTGKGRGSERLSLENAPRDGLPETFEMATGPLEDAPRDGLPETFNETGLIAELE